MLPTINNATTKIEWGNTKRGRWLATPELKGTPGEETPKQVR